MKKLLFELLVVAGGMAFAAGCGRAPVSVATEAERLADPLSIARMDGRDTVMHSSWDRTGGNDDWGTFLRDSAEPGWKVVADLQGPGVLTRFWFTGAKDGLPFRFRFFFDGEAEARFGGDVKEWCGGGMEPFAAPLAEYANYCWHSFVPMPYAKSLRVECEAGPEGAKPYFQLSETKLPPGTEVESFAWPLPDRDRAALARLREVWSEGFPAGAGTETVEAVLSAESPVMELEGRGVVRRLGFEPEWGLVPEGERDALLREMRVGVRYGGAQEESVWAPLGDLCGMPWRRVRAKSLYFGMEGEELFCAFPMPFADGMEVRLDSGKYGKVPVRVRAVREAVGRRELKGLGRFHAAWKRSGLKEVGSPHPVLHARGEGKYVGCLLAVCTLDGSYWALEGDETIRKDAETAPGWRGTGLEDYFNGGWYYQNVMAAPTHGLLAKEPFRTVQYRVHAADPSVFAQSLDMEFERGPDNVSHAYFESTAWYYLKEPARADSARLAPGYRKTPTDPRLDPFNAMAAAWNAERFGDWTGARDEFARRLATEGPGWTPGARRMAELRLALYGEAIAGSREAGTLAPFLEDADPKVREAAEVLRSERAGESVTALLWANMPAELFIDGECVLRAGDPAEAAVAAVKPPAGEHLVAIRTALQAYPDWVLLAMRKGDWFAGTEADWKFAIDPPGEAVEADFDDSGWAAMQGTGVKGPPEEPYVQVAVDPWIGMQSRAVGVRPTGDKPAEGTAVYRARVVFP
ncbi:MAG: DUF2961 domain-containing protein [Kiritimatiellae bacterium]|nr:DUF2961 domain-containing protein [Kiritimatiellia bacterium]